ERLQAPVFLTPSKVRRKRRRGANPFPCGHFDLHRPPGTSLAIYAPSKGGADGERLIVRKPMRTWKSKATSLHDSTTHITTQRLEGDEHMTATRIRAACLAVLLCTGLSALAFGDEGEKDSA